MSFVPMCLVSHFPFENLKNKVYKKTKNKLAFAMHFKQILWNKRPFYSGDPPIGIFHLHMGLWPREGHRFDLYSIFI